MELSKLQQEIINDSNDKIVLLSCSASGKTRTLTEKVRQVLKNGTDPKKIAVITFTNMAAEELRQRLGEDYKDGIFIGTIHSLANQFLLNYGVDTKKTIENEDFDNLFYLVKKNLECIKEIDFLALDEAQDSDKQQFDFIFKMINPKKFFVVGDLRQHIYSFAGADSKLLYKLTQQENVKTLSLNENYRNSKEILKFAKKIIKPTGLEDDSIPMVKLKGKVIETYISDNAIVKGFEKNKDYKNWAVLAWSNATVDRIYKLLTKNHIPCETFKQGNLTKEELKQKMNNNSVKILTIHSAKGLEWNNVIVKETRIGNSNENRFLMYVAATRAKETLYWNIGQNFTYRKKQQLSNWE